MNGYPTCRRHPRTLGEAFPDVRSSWGDEIVMSRWNPAFDGDFVETYDTTAQPEAASACSEFGHEDQQPKAQTVTPWQRIKRAVRGWWYGRMKP